MKKTLLISSLILIVAIGFFVVKHYTMLLDNKDEAVAINKSYEWKDDFSDKRRVSGAAKNIFIGEVIEQVGTKDFQGKPSTQYSVRITQNIKGGFLNDIIVNQQGGYYKDSGKLYLLQYENDRFLKPGKMYLFATAPDPNEDWQQMIPKYGNTPISNEKQKFNLIDQYKEAIASEIKPNAKTWW